MTRKPDIQYIEDFYVPGSEAPKVQPKWGGVSVSAVPAKATKSQIRIQVDPVALIGVVVAIAMLVLMVVGILQYTAARQELQEMTEYVGKLTNETRILRHEYHNGYDMEWVQEQALALGMIPIAEATTIRVAVTVPEPEPEPTFWENVLWFLEGLFA